MKPTRKEFLSGATFYFDSLDGVTSSGTYQVLPERGPEMRLVIRANGSVISAPEFTKSEASWWYSSQVRR